MQLLKKIIWSIVVLLLVGIFAYGAIILKNSFSASNYMTYWQQEQLTEGNFTMVVMGDSTAIGVGASKPQNSFVGIVASKIEEAQRKRVRVVNLSTQNSTYQDIVTKQIPKSREYKADLVIVSAGRADIDNGSFDLLTMQNLMSSLPGVDSYITEIPASYDQAKNKIIMIANKAISDIADSSSVNVIPLYSITSRSLFDLSYYDWDFIHPNDRGHNQWAEAVWAAVE